MKKVTTQEWTALCRDCTWCGKRRSDRDSAVQELANHLKRHSKHKARVMVTGEDSSMTAEIEQNRVQEAWSKITKREGQVRLG